MRIGSEVRPRMTLRSTGRSSGSSPPSTTAARQDGRVMHAKLRDLHTGKERERRFRAEEAVEEVPPDRQSLQFLFTDAGVSTFMNPQTYEQVAIDSARLGKAGAWLTEETVVPVELVDGEPVGIVFPEIAEGGWRRTAAPTTRPEPTTSGSKRGWRTGSRSWSRRSSTSGSGPVDVETGRYVERAKAKVVARSAPVSEEGSAVSSCA